MKNSIELTALKKQKRKGKGKLTEVKKRENPN